MAPDRQCADAAPAARIEHMHGPAVNDVRDVAVPGQTKKSTSGIASAQPEITRRDVHSAPSVNVRRRYPENYVKEPSLAQQAALRRSSAKGKDTPQETPPESSSAASSKPVLVRAPSNSDMKKRPKPRVHTGSPKLPSPESFTFQDILASIGPEGDASISAIAEICGRSKLSLAEEHDSHRPPHAQVVNTGSSPAESLPSMRLETVAEATSNGPQTRSKSKSLALAKASGNVMSSDATAATSNVTTHAYSQDSARRMDWDSSDSVSTPLISQILAWLRGSSTETGAPSASDRDPGTVRILQNMLSDTDNIRS